MLFCYAAETPAAFRSVHRTHVQLAKHIRNFDGCLQQLMQAATGPSQARLQQQLVAAVLSLPLESPLTAARLAAEKKAGLPNKSSAHSASAPAAASSAAAEGAPAAAAAAEVVQVFLKSCLGLTDTDAVEAAPVRDLHAFSSESASAAEVALDVQAFCQEFAAAIKEAHAASAAAAASEQQEEEGHPQSGAAAATSPKPIKITRQQMLRQFAYFRSMLRNDLKLPCLSMCGNAQGLFAAALNDDSGLPGPLAAPHPLQHAASLQQHDTAARASATLKRVKGGEGGMASWLAKAQTAAGTPKSVGDLLGDTWSSAAQQWYLMLQMLLQCQEHSSPHKDVAAYRDGLLGFAAALLLHALQQRRRCWQAAAEFQELADAAAVSLAAPSVSVPADAAAALLDAAETLKEGLRQARAVLPTVHEAAVQNDALEIAFAVRDASASTSGICGAATGALGVPGEAGAAAASADAAATVEADEKRTLLHDVEHIRRARNVVTKALQELEKLQQLLRDTPEARRLAAARRVTSPEELQHCNARMRVRVQWLEGIKAACTAAVEPLKPAAGLKGNGENADVLSDILPSHAAAGLRKACTALQARHAALADAAALAAAQEKTKNRDGRLAATLEALRKSLKECGGQASQDQEVDSLIQIPSRSAGDVLPLHKDEKELQQPVFDSLPLPPLDCLFPFKACTAAVDAFGTAAPAYLSCPLLQRGAAAGAAAAATTAAAARGVALQMLQRAAAVVLSAFDALEGTTRLCLSFVQLLLVLLDIGFGRLSNEEEEAAASEAARPQKQKNELESGTGLGEGDALRDAEEPPQDEWQFDGLKDEKADPHQKPPEKPKTEEEVKNHKHPRQYLKPWELSLNFRAVSAVCWGASL